MIERLADAGIPIDRCCRVLGVARQHYYRVKRKPLTQSELRRQWLTGLIREVHVTSRGTYGYRRVHAELTMAMGVTVSERTVHKLMRLAGIYGLPGPVRTKRLRGVVTADDLVNRKFARPRPNELWVTDITQHRTREGWVYCAAVLDAYSRRTVGWSIDSKQDTPRSSSTRSIWPSGIVAQRREGSSTRTTERNSPRGCSGRRSAPRGCCPRSDRLATGSTTR